MPGFTFLCSPGGEHNGAKFSRSLDELLHDERYRRETVYESGAVRLSLTRYPEYPVVILDEPDYLVVVEGHVYGCTGADLRADVLALARDMFDDDAGTAVRIRSWLERHDGAFVVLAREKRTGGWAFLNDTLARLPVYAYQDGSRFCLSREIMFFPRYADALSLDRAAVAHYLLFGFPLGGRTLLEGVRRLPAATLVRCHPPTGDVHRQTLHRFDLRGNDVSRRAADVVEDLVSSFTAACQRQADPDGHNVMSLSGGLDSRTVAAGLLAAGSRFNAVTFDDGRGSASIDAVRARELADSMKLHWELVNLPPPTGREVRQIFNIKGGLVSSAMASDIRFLDHIEKRFGRNVTFFSGDGGDKVLPDLRPPRRLTSPRAVARYVTSQFRVMPPAMVADLTGISQERILEQVEAQVASYPEESPDQKYIHFMFYEHGVNWLFEGEDRNRSAVWNATPFYDQSFFRQVMSCSWEQKKNHRLYAAFLARLSPPAAAIADATRGGVVTSSAYRRRLSLITLVSRYPSLAQRLRDIRRPGRSYPAASPIIQCIARRNRRCEAMSDYLNPRALDRVAAHPGKLTQQALHNLLDITTLIEFITGSPDTLADFADAEFK
ncbi:MAG TPA: asparagine synthase-related protein [Acidobacteriota bacterium]|nr:asparagine synthase-related protein [Acidobacteriota bacterium]